MKMHMQEKQGIIVGDYVARDKYVFGAGTGEDDEVPTREIIDLVPRVPSRYVGPIPLLKVYRDLPTDAFVFHYPVGGGSEVSSLARPTKIDLETVIPSNVMAHELLTDVSESVVLLGSSGSGKTTVLYRLAQDLMARSVGEIVLLDGSGAFGARVSRMLATDSLTGASSLAKAAGLHRSYGRTSQVVIDTLLIDHLYLMNENLAAAAAQVANAIVDKYGPRRIVMADLSAVAARRRGVHFSACEVELASLRSDQIGEIIAAYKPYLRMPDLSFSPPPDASTPEEALSERSVEEYALEPLLAKIRHGLQSATRSKAVLRRIPAVFYAAVSKYPLPVTQAEVLDVLCDGDILGTVQDALPVAVRLLELGLFVIRSDESNSLYVSDLALAKGVAAASNVSMTGDVRGALIDVASKRLSKSSDRDAVNLLKQILGARPGRSSSLADLDDLQRRASLAAAFLRARESDHLDRALALRLDRLSSSLRKYSRSPSVALRLRETLLRDAVELDSWLGHLDDEIEFTWVPPGVARFRLPREQDDQSYFLARGLYFASRPVTELQLWRLRKALGIEVPRPARRNLQDPATMISWADMRDLSVRLNSRIAGHGYLCDLPSVPEWALARETLSREGDAVGNVINTPLCLGHRCPADLYANEGEPYFGGGILEWSRTSWGSHELDKPGYTAPYDPIDGREDPDSAGMRMLRGGSWLFRENEAFCSCVLPVNARFSDVGVRFCLIPASLDSANAEKIRLSLADGPRIKEVI
jgi:energy-coupling factor transporter ATP-binding protein EcfA2